MKYTIYLAQLRGAPENDNRVNSGIHSEAVIELVWRCTWRLGSSKFGDAHGGRDSASLEMHLEAAIGRVWDAIGSCDRVTEELHLEAAIGRVWRCTWRPQSSEFVDALRGHD